MEKDLGDTPSRDKEEVMKAMTNLECYPVLIDDAADMEQYTKLPIRKMSSFGNDFLNLAKMFENITMADGGEQGLYKIILPEGGKLAKVMDGINLLKSIAGEETPVKGKPVASATKSKASDVVALSCNPTTLIVVAALAGIERRLGEIEETQQEILGFLTQKEKSEMRGDLNFLSDILSNFKFNWDNDKYKNSNHIKVLDVKQAAERKIDFYSEQIKSKISKRSFLYGDKNIEKQITDVGAECKNHEFALYLFAFSTLVEVMLLENFDSGYLDGLVNKIESYIGDYRELYTSCYDMIEGYSKSSVQSSLLKGLASVTAAAGKTVARVPRIGDSQIDETLTESGKKLDKKVIQRTGQIMQQFFESRIDYVQPFIDNIKLINKLHNQPVEILFDDENVYFEDLA